jgi:hypothetical protein
MPELNVTKISASIAQLSREVYLSFPLIQVVIGRGEILLKPMEKQ